MYCKICGEPNCKKHSILLGKAVPITQFSGSSPPEIFVGKWNYPNVYTGILSPQQYGDTKEMSSHEYWHAKKFPIPNILELRNKLIYSRTQTNIHKAKTQDKFLNTMQEVAMTEESIAAEYKLKKAVSPNLEKEKRVPLISNAAIIQNVRLEENPKVKRKVDYLVNDVDVKSTNSLIELEKSKIPTSALVKLLSAGLLGLRKNRRLVPTRWSITAVDDALSKNKLNNIRFFPEISSIQIFHAEYLGNHYEFLLLPDKYSFEVMEISLKLQANQLIPSGTWHDYESFFPRKKYADSVTGAYYANRLALTEYLTKIKRQAKCLVIREVRPEYTSPLGVGILRQISREAFSKKPETFFNLNEALNKIQSRLKQPIKNYTEKSWLLENYGKQKKLHEFF